MGNPANRLRALGALFAPLGGCDAETAYAEAGLEAPDVRIRRRFELDVLTPGGAVSLLPVESLYKMWADPRSRGRGQACAFGAARHMYMGDSAHHVKSILRKLGMEVPEGFEAMPDHLALLCELAAVFYEAGNAPALESLLREHFDWLDAYACELAARKAQLEYAPDPDARTSECIEAIDHALALLSEVEEAARKSQREEIKESEESWK